jgi:hypothetical protein
MTGEIAERSESKSCVDLVTERGDLVRQLFEVDIQLGRKVEAFLLKVNVEMGSREILALRRGVHFQVIRGTTIQINCELRNFSVLAELRTKGLNIVEGADSLAVIVDVKDLD